MNQSELVRRLKEYWKPLKIGADGFDCAKAAQCKAASPDTFVPATDPHIGQHFGDGIPKLVFVSLDPGARSQNDQRRIERSEPVNKNETAGS